jgi:hypothetical protein
MTQYRCWSQQTRRVSGTGRGSSSAHAGGAGPSNLTRESLKAPTPQVSNPLINPTPSVTPPSRGGTLGGRGAGRSAAEVCAGTRVFKSPTPLGVPVPSALRPAPGLESSNPPPPPLESLRVPTPLVVPPPSLGGPARAGVQRRSAPGPES